MRSRTHPESQEGFRTVGNPVGLLHGDRPQPRLKSPWNPDTGGIQTTYQNERPSPPRPHPPRQEPLSLRAWPAFTGKRDPRGWFDPGGLPSGRKGLSPAPAPQAPWYRSLASPTGTARLGLGDTRRTPITGSRGRRRRHGVKGKTMQTMHSDSTIAASGCKKAEDQQRSRVPSGGYAASCAAGASRAGLCAPYFVTFAEGRPS
jgi:hypothetical protein